MMKVGDRIGQMVVGEYCELCETVLLWRADNGTAVRFTAHSPEYCKSATLGRIAFLMRMLRDAAVEQARIDRERVEACRMLHDAREKIEELAGIAGVELCTGCGDVVHETETDPQGRCRDCCRAGAPA